MYGAIRSRVPARLRLLATYAFLVAGGLAALELAGGHLPSLPGLAAGFALGYREAFLCDDLARPAWRNPLLSGDGAIAVLSSAAYAFSFALVVGCAWAYLPTEIASALIAFAPGHAAGRYVRHLPTFVRLRGSLTSKPEPKVPVTTPVSPTAE